MIRKFAFINGDIYHVFNRGVEKRLTFTNSRDYERGIQTFTYYRLKNPPIRFSYFLRLSKDAHSFVVEQLERLNEQVDILSFCFMPNHFHFLLRQTEERGISRFIADFTNSYTKYFNTKYKRVGHLFQGAFKAVRIETDEQLVHVSRYIHLNPVSSFLIEPEELKNYFWSSYIEYLRITEEKFIETSTILSMFKNSEDYKQFVLDRIDYGRNLEIIKHLTLEDDE